MLSTKLNWNNSGVSSKITAIVLKFMLIIIGKKQYSRLIDTIKREYI